jgi:DNA-binding SARP family transcriptional activator
MPFIAKSAAPGVLHPAAGHWAFERAAAGGLTLFTAPPGYLLTEGLFDALQRQGRRVLWLRLGPEDRDPGMFLLSVVAAARRQRPDFGGSTLDLMRRQPGPVAGWPPLFGRLAAELAEMVSESGALVLEHAHHLSRVHPTITILGTHLLPAIDSDAACVITSHEELPATALPVRATRRSTRDLRLAPAEARELLARDAPGLSPEASRRAAMICQGKIAGLVAISGACAVLGLAVVERAIARARRGQELLSLLAKAWLQTIGRDGRRALGLTLQLEYTHPALTEAVLEGSVPPPGPWLQPLADGWSRVRTVWHDPLQDSLSSRRLLAPETVHRAADYLLGRGAPERAIPLYLKLRDAACAARALAEEADRLVDLGQWDTLGDWLAGLPADVLKVEPRLLYDQAEVAAASGHGDAAQRGFSAAASRFTALYDPDGVCRSMLAESALAAGRGDYARAKARAHAASVVADAAGIAWHQLWASWQLGWVAVGAQQLDSAPAHFGRAAAIASQVGERHLVDVVLEAERLTDRLQQLRRRQDELREAGLALQRAEQEATARIVEHLGGAADHVHGLLGAHGWTHTPLALKVSVLQAPSALAPPADAERWWCRLRRPLASRRPAAPNRTAHPAGEPSPGASVVRASDHPAMGVAVPVLTAHLLGQLRVTLNDAPIDEWPSGRGRSLLKYLLTHRDPWPQREVVMEVFWPDASPEAARNSLNVAVHGLRRALRGAADVPVIVLEGGAYRLAANLRLWVDVDEFERHVEGGRRLEAAGEPTGAMAQYELAASLYQGDFLADDPYEEWPVLTRERLRLAYLDLLDRLGRLYFGQGRYAACAALCQRIIERDACREDAHRRLIRCYSRQGQPHLALRQYLACAEALRTELGVDPAPATVRLHEAIRRYEPV